MGDRSLRDEIADLVKIALIGETQLGDAEERLIVKVALVRGIARPGNVCLQFRAVPCIRLTRRSARLRRTL